MQCALVGGILIGASASLAWSGANEIAGISGILGRVLRAPLSSPFQAWFLVGLFSVSLLLGRLGGAWTESSVSPRPLVWILVSGVLVGFGTRLGSGCTSGHGVCGLSRGSLRSFVATGTFMLVAGLILFCTRHLLAGARP